MTKRWLLIFVALGGVLVVGVVGWWLHVGYKSSPRSWPAEEFSAAKWKAAAPEQRYVYYRDLAGSGRLDAARKQEVVDMLGLPDYEDPRGRTMSYTLKYGGFDEPLFNSVYFLNIELHQPDGTVQRYEVRAD